MAQDTANPGQGAISKRVADGSYTSGTEARRRVTQSLVGQGGPRGVHAVRALLNGDRDVHGPPPPTGWGGGGAGGGRLTWTC